MDPNLLLGKNFYDIVFIGSGFSARYLLEKIKYEKLRVLIINSHKSNLNINGIIHKDGNTYTNHKIRIAINDIKKLKNLEEYNSEKLILKTDLTERPNLNFKNLNIDNLNINIKTLRIESSNQKKYKLYLKNSKYKFETDYVFIGTSFSSIDILKNTKFNGKSFLSEKELGSIKEKNNFSTILMIDKSRKSIFNLKESNWESKYAKFTRLKRDIYFHIYLKKFTFNSFKKEWELAYFSSLIKERYLYLSLLFIIKKPLILLSILLKIFRKKKYALYISLESNNHYPSNFEITELEKNLIKSYKFNKNEKILLRKALNKFVCNSHYHANLEVNKYENIYLIGSTSINRTFSSNPTGIILDQINKISKKFLMDIK